MSINKELFNLTSAQRAYYIVALQFKNSSDYSMEKYWKDCKDEKISTVKYIRNFDDYDISHCKYETNFKYPNGVDGDALSKPPYFFDLFAIHMKHSNIMIFAYPFKSIAYDIINKLISKKILLNSNFVKPILTNLLRFNHEREKYVGKGFSSHFSAVDLTLTGIINLSSVSLTGDKPLQSLIYKKVFKILIETEKGKLDKCAIKFISDGISAGFPKSTANIHIDHFGNYKLYLYKNGNNLLALPALFNMLENYDCIDLTSSNPLNRIENE